MVEESFDRLIDFNGAHAWPALFAAQIERFGDDFARLAHQSNFTGRFELGRSLEEFLEHGDLQVSWRRMGRANNDVSIFWEMTTSSARAHLNADLAATPPRVKKKILSLGRPNATKPPIYLLSAHVRETTFSIEKGRASTQIKNPIVT